MSTIQTNQAEQRGAPTAAVRTCTITWPIARAEVLRAQPELGFPSKPRGHIELRIVIETETKAHAELVDPSSGHTHRLELGSPRLTFVDAEPYTHIELTDAERLVLACTIKRRDDGDLLLYARTDLMNELSIIGGRYSCPLCSCITINNT